MSDWWIAAVMADLLEPPPVCAQDLFFVVVPRFLENVFGAPKVSIVREAGMSDEYLYLRFVFTSEAQKSSFKLKHP